MDKTASTKFTSNSRKLSWQKFNDYLECEFTVHYTCTNAERDLKSTSANGLNFPILILWDNSKRYKYRNIDVCFLARAPVCISH